MAVTQDMVDRALRFEASIAHMYLDTKGNVTIGVGHLLPAAQAAGRLPMQVVASGAAATSTLIRAEFTLMQQQPAGRLPSFYRRVRTLEMQGSDIDALLRTDLEGSLRDLQSIFSGFDAFPPPAREALVDMVFNLGKNGLLKFANLIAACKAQDWLLASTESSRRDVPAARNTEIRQLFESLAATSPMQRLLHQSMRGLLTSVGPLEGTGVHTLETSFSSPAGTWTVRTLRDRDTPATTAPGATPESCREAYRAAPLLAPRPDDLALGEKVPPTSEVAASGAIQGKIRRPPDPRYASLVECTSAGIVFKDEEGTGADRMMSPRLKTALERLAVATRQEWSNVSLRVTEAWDEDNEHAGQSLHYEGRAADLTTSPVDPSKLGRLGRLAVEAGFEWVWYENAAHIHVSVRA